MNKIREIATSILTKGKDKILPVAVAAAVAVNAMPVQVYAAGTSDITAPISKLKTLLIAIFSVAGLVFLVYGGASFATSFSKQDQNGEHQAIYKIVAGGILIGIDLVVAFLVN